ncbi:MAG TPA: LysR family transcriptional regulator [Dehalococcoidia bacterium]|nr:LysR family transcriptional regulator [Dehalococcoidia bacterium]
MKTHESLLVDVSARQLRAFTTVATTLSYAEAAERLHYTEPGVYAQVKRLESVLGCRLFERHGRGVRLTAEGTALLPACRATLVEIDRIESVRQRIARARRIGIAAGPVTGSYLLPALIRAFAEEEPDILVDLLTAPTEEVMDLVASGTADVGVCGSLDRLPVPEHLRVSSWLDEPFTLCAAGELAQSLTPPLVVYGIAKALGPVSLLRDRFDELGVTDWETRYLASADAVKGACMAGLGYALLPCRATELERRVGALKVVPGFTEPVLGHVWICEPKDRPPHADVNTFVRFLRESDSRLTSILSQA